MDNKSELPPSYGDVNQSAPGQPANPPPYLYNTNQTGQPEYTPMQGQGYAMGPTNQSIPPGYPPQQYYQGYPQQGQYAYSNVVVQTQPGMQPGMVAGAPPPDHMCAAIFVTLFCFWPTGILAILRASDARNAAARGDMAGAHSLARSAKSMINMSIIIGIISVVVLLIIIGVYLGVVLNNYDSFDD